MSVRNLSEVCFLLAPQQELKMPLSCIYAFISPTEVSATEYLSSLNHFFGKIGCAYHIAGDYIVIRKTFSTN